MTLFIAALERDCWNIAKSVASHIHHEALCVPSLINCVLGILIALASLMESVSTHFAKPDGKCVDTLFETRRSTRYRYFLGGRGAVLDGIG